MEKYNYGNEELKLRKKLKNMRMLATSLLVFMTIAFVVFKRYEDKGLLYSSIAAFAEASMVGALADWFAVVALFRHPLGLKIPHTAIIQNNKKRIAKALSNFVVSNFFTPEIIKAKLDKVSVAQKVSKYVQQNKGTISKGIANKLPVILNTFVDDIKLEGYIKELVYKKINGLELYPVLGELLGPALESGYHKPIVKGLLEATYKFISENKEKTLVVLGGINRTFSMPFIGDLVYKKILEFLLRQIEEIDTNQDVEVNKLLMAALPKLLDDMKNSQELIEKGQQLKEQIVNSTLFGELVDKLVTIIIGYRNSFVGNEEELTKKVAAILDIVVNGISENNVLRENIDNAIVESAEGIVSLYGSKVGSLIYDTMDSWETKSMVDKLEVQVGADLQYIRINGTIIGGLAGLAIHFLSLIF